MAAMPDPAAVDALIERCLIEEDRGLADCLTHSAKSGLPDIAVSSAQGRFLQMLVRLVGARRVLEVGTLGGYSTIHFARGLSADGEIVTLEARKTYAAVAQRNLENAGVAEQVELIIGPALKTLATLDGPFDLTFIDADKPNNCNYVDHALRLSRPGSLIIVDNVVREGAILDPDEKDESAKGTRALYEHVAGIDRLEATALQTVGAKGWDGMMFLRVRD